MKADLHYHGAIGFEREWLRMQGYSEKNLTKMIADAALARGIGLVAITSEGLNFSPGHWVHDRFYRLCEEARTLPLNYSHDKLGEVALIIDKKEAGRVIIVNGQTVLVREGEGRFDHLVIGSNRVPNLKSIGRTLDYCSDNGLPNFLEHPIVSSHYGFGRYKAEEILEAYLENITGVEGHNAQMIVPKIFSFLPVVGNYNRGANDAAVQLARKYKKPFISSSDGHKINEVGAANIEFEDDEMDISNGERFLASLKRILEQGAFVHNKGYTSLGSWLRWTSTFAFGLGVFPRLKL